MKRYHVQVSGGVSELDEDDVITRLRAGGLNGLELARVEGEEAWRPLHELEVFRQAVPHVGDPGDAARRRVASGLLWHVIIYAIATGWIFGASVPALIWGVFVAFHAARALPVTIALARKGALFGPGRSPAALPGASAAGLPAAPAAPALAGAEPGSAAALPPASDADAVLADVRSLLARRTSDDASPQLDGVADSLRELRGRIARLSAVLATQDRSALEEQLGPAQAALEAADPDDVDLRRREVDVLRDSLATHDRARKVLERLRLRERLAVQELQRLRLDLVRAEADAAGPEDVGERLDQIRFEAEAADEADALVGPRP